MSTPSDKLAVSLAVLKTLQDQGIVAIRARQLSRTHRERLLKSGYIREVMKGWYICARPDEPPGDSTAWYAAFWAFCAGYLNERFAANWCLSPEQSLSLHVGKRTVPKQLLVRSPKGGNKPTPLPYGTSIFDIRLKLPPAKDIETQDGLRVIALPAALIGCAAGEFVARPADLRAALAMITDASDVLRHLLAGGHSLVAGRLAGAFRNNGADRTADQIMETMRKAGYTVNETNPFEGSPAIAFSARETSPYVNRLRLMWAEMRGPILQTFPAAPGRPMDPTSYLKRVDELYTTDAYHSLSIEGYRVSAELIERVHSGNWNPDNDVNDRENRNALAARGYWQAFQRVKKSVEDVLRGQNPGAIADQHHSTWYVELLGPSITAGILSAAELAGYRSAPVYIRRSMHVPPSREAVRELMPTFFDLLRNEPEPAVRIVLGHFAFVYIHPYMDGNGRMGRFLMNLMMASAGHPWTIIPVERRGDYVTALEAASVEQNIALFADFLASLVAAGQRATLADIGLVPGRSRAGVAAAEPGKRR